MQRETTEATATSAATDAAAADEHVIFMELMAGGNNIGLLRQVSTLSMIHNPKVTSASHPKMHHIHMKFWTKPSTEILLKSGYLLKDPAHPPPP